jgi:hypothetical protein
MWPRAWAQLAEIAHHNVDLAGAEAYVREAVAVRRRIGTGQDSALARDLAHLARLQCARGDNVGCERSLREAVDIAQHAFPAPHREHSFLLLRLAEALDDQPAQRPPRRARGSRIALFRRRSPRRVRCSAIRTPRPRARDARGRA